MIKGTPEQKRKENMKFLQVINLARDKLSRKQLEYQGHP